MKIPVLFKLVNICTSDIKQWHILRPIILFNIYYCRLEATVHTDIQTPSE